MNPGAAATTLGVRRKSFRMDHTREVELILTIDHDVRQLLGRCNDLMSAGDERPLLTHVGRQLRDQLRGVAELSGLLATLVSDGGEAPRGRTQLAAGASANRSRDRREPAAVATPTSAPVIRLKPRMPRGAWRRRGIVGASQHPVVSIETAEARPADDETREPTDTPAHEPVYRLRKAGVAEPVPVAASGHDDRNALDRLRDFFGDAKGGRPRTS